MTAQRRQALMRVLWGWRPDAGDQVPATTARTWNSR